TNYSIYLYELPSHQLKLIENDSTGMPEDWVLSENYTPSFSKNNKNLFLGIAPKKFVQDSTFVEEDHAVLDIWHYKDDYLQPQQLVRLKRDLARSFLSVVNLDKPDQLIQLQDEKTNFSQLVDEGNSDYVFAMSDYGNRIRQQWDVAAIRTYALIDTKTGDKKDVI